MYLSQKVYYFVWVILLCWLFILGYFNTQYQKYNLQLNNDSQSNDIQDFSFLRTYNNSFVYLASKNFKDYVFLEEPLFKPSSMNISTWILIHPLRYSDTYSIWCSINYFTKKTWLRWFVNSFLVVNYDQKEIWFILWFNNYMPSRCDSYYNYLLLEEWFNYKNITPKLEKIKKSDIYIYYPDYERLEYKWDTCDDMYYQPIVEADFDSFMLRTGWMYASDKNNTYIFWRHDVPFSWEALIPNFSVLKNEKWIIDHPYYKLASSWDFDKIYEYQKEIENKDCRMFLRYRP